MSVLWGLPLVSIPGTRRDTTNLTLNLPYTLHCILHTAYCILYTVHCILHTAHYIMYTVHCILPMENVTLHT